MHHTKRLMSRALTFFNSNLLIIKHKHSPEELNKEKITKKSNNDKIFEK